MSWCPWWRKPKVEQENLYEDVIEHGSVDVNVDSDSLDSGENVVLSYDNPIEKFQDDFIENLDELASDVNSNVSDFNENITENVNDFKENVEEDINQFVDYSEEKFEDVKENVNEFMENTNEYVEEKLENMKENVNEFVDYSEEKLEDVKENVNEFVDYSEEKLEDVKENVNDFMENVNNADDGYKADNEGGIYDLNQEETVKEVATKFVDEAIQEAIKSTSESQFEQLDTIDEEYFSENRRMSFDSAEENTNIKPYVSHPIIETSIEDDYQFPETQTRNCEVCGKLIFYNKHEKVACFRCDECLIKYMN